MEYTWVQGRYQVTKHTIQGLGKAGYPAIKRYTSMTQGRGGDITALNVYEHDYKLDSNGYASTDPDFRWSTNLWGAYRETRASGAGPKLDFTIGSLHTWLLDASKVYTVNVYVPLSQRSDRPKGSTAHLVAEILPNDGGFVPGAMGGCSLPIDPLDNDRLLDLGATDLSWCAGVGGGLGAQTDHRVLIAKAGFPVGEEVRCWSWVVNHGGRAC